MAEQQVIPSTQPNSPSSERDELTNPRGSNRNWRQRSKTIITLSAIGLVICLGIIYYFVKSKNREVCRSTNASITELQNVCTAPECIYAASKTIKYMDFNIQPCDDFYRFSCENLISSAVIPDGEIITDTLSNIKNIYREQLRTSLEEKIQPEEPRIFKLVKNIYQNCMNKDKNLSSALNIVEKLGGWPVLQGNSWQDKDYQWEKTIYNIKAEGLSISSLFSLTVESSFVDEDQFVLNIDQAAFLLPIEILKDGLNDLTVQSYYRYMIDIAVILGANKIESLEELMGALDFEIQLATISMKKVETRNYKSMTVKELEGNYTTIPWRRIFNQLLGPKVKVSENEVVIVNSPSYWNQLEELLEETPKRFQANYLVWRAIASIATYLSEDIRRRELQFLGETSELNEREARWKECITFAGTQVEPLVSAFYINKYFNENTKTGANEIVTNVKKEFMKILNSMEWMNEEERKTTTKKVESMEIQVGYPEDLLDLYINLEITPGTYLQTYLNLTLFNTNYYFNKLIKHEIMLDLIESLPTKSERSILKFFYSPRRNSIIIPAGILQGEFFNMNRPQYINYGTLGLAIGRQIINNFNSQMREFNEAGNVGEWWERETNKYLSKTNCFLHQFNNYTSNNFLVKLQDILTIGKNIADNGAIKTAYYAYQEWMKYNRLDEAKLPALDFAPSQLFWITAAQMWCSESYDAKMALEYHNPAKFRILTSFVNMEEFANDFKCLEASKMNPTNRCSFW